MLIDNDKRIMLLRPSPALLQRMGRNPLAIGAARDHRRGVRRGDGSAGRRPGAGRRRPRDWPADRQRCSMMPRSRLAY